MTIEIGQRLGPYEIEAPAGKGGMGEVYRAKDTRLDRTVAIKVLPSHTALNSDMKARFKREAKTISSLNHPNVCTLYDVGHEDGIDFLVMEFLEGEPLDERLKRGKFETDEALRIGAQIAGALDAAHRKGLVHRDLKPSNIYLTKEGAKLLDFGLAKLQAEAVSGMDDKTHTTPVTGEGAIVGTLQYMSPEQLEGREADGRSDIFSFGAVLYEMVTGQRAFSGDSKASLIGSIMKEEPRAISEIQPTSPPSLDRLIRKCLKKDPEKRWQSASDLKDELDWINSAGSQAGGATFVAERRKSRLRLSWLIAAGFFFATLFLLIQRLSEDKSPEISSVLFTIPIPESTTSVEWPQVSPDGQYLAFRAYDTTGTNGWKICVRPLGSSEAYPLPGTLGARRPFWSPDSKFIAYFEIKGGYLKKVPLAGGDPIPICKAEGVDGNWGSDDVIVFDGESCLNKVPASGGEPQPASRIDQSVYEKSHGWPSFLPDGHHFLFSAFSDSLDNPRLQQILMVGNVDNFETKRLGVIDSRAVYCWPGYVVYRKGDVNVAHRFDDEKLELVGSPIPLSDDIGFPWNNPSAINVSASNNGVLVTSKVQYVSVAIDRQCYLIWVDREGRVLDTIAGPSDYRDIELSPDNRQLSYMSTESDGDDLDVWVLDLQRNVSRRITLTGWNEIGGTWSPDGSRLAYCILGDIKTTVYYCNANGIGESVRIISRDSSFFAPHSWLTENRLMCCDFPYFLSGMEEIRALRYPLTRELIISIDDTTQQQEVIRSRGHVATFGVSEDGRYILYINNGYLYISDIHEKGRWQVAPPPVSSAKWSPMGDEIFYFMKDDFMVIDVNYDNGFTFGTPRKLFSRKHLETDARYFSLRGYDVSNDGQRFVFIEPSKERDDKRADICFELIINWHNKLDGTD